MNNQDLSALILPYMNGSSEKYLAYKAGEATAPTTINAFQMVEKVAGGIVEKHNEDIEAANRKAISDKKQIDALQSEKATAVAKILEGERTLSAKESQLSQLNGQLSGLQSQLAESKRQLAEKAGQSTNNDSQLKLLQSQLAETKDLLAASESQLKTSAEQLETNKAQLNTTQKQLAANQIQLETLTIQLAEAENTIDVSTKKAYKRDSFWILFISAVAFIANIKHLMAGYLKFLPEHAKTGSQVFDFILALLAFISLDGAIMLFIKYKQNTLAAIYSAGTVILTLISLLWIDMRWAQVTFTIIACCMISGIIFSFSYLKQK